MKLIPNKKLENIPTGNPYAGKSGLVDLGPNQSTLNVAELFPFHQVDNGSLENIRSYLLGGQIRVGYLANNMISEIEILSPDPRIPEMKIQELVLGKCQVFGRRLSELKHILEEEGFEITTSEEGLDLKDGSVLFYSHDYEGDLDVDLDAVVLKFS